jgi:class 3 adenylate cyclase
VVAVAAVALGEQPEEKEHVADPNAHTIAAGLLAAYLGSDAGRRVHANVVERGSVESIRAVLWYADIRGFTPLAKRGAKRDPIEA